MSKRKEFNDKRVEWISSALRRGILTYQEAVEELAKIQSESQESEEQPEKIPVSLYQLGAWFFDRKDVLDVQREEFVIQACKWLTDTRGNVYNRQKITEALNKGTYTKQLKDKTAFELDTWWRKVRRT